MSKTKTKTKKAVLTVVTDTANTTESNRNNCVYRDYGKQAVEAFKLGDTANTKAGALTVYALVIAHQQAMLPNNLTIEGYADIDGKVERKRMGAWYDAVLEEVFGITPAHATAADQKRIRHHMPVVLNIIGNKSEAGEYPCRLNSVTGCLQVEGYLLTTEDKLANEWLEIDGTKFSMAKFISASKKALGISSKLAAHHKGNKQPEGVIVAGRDADAIAQATVREDVMPRAMRIMANSLNGLEKGDLTKDTVRAAQDLLISLIGIFGESESVQLYNKDAA